MTFLDLRVILRIIFYDYDKHKITTTDYVVMVALKTMILSDVIFTNNTSTVLNYILFSGFFSTTNIVHKKTHFFPRTIK